MDRNLAGVGKRIGGGVIDLIVSFSLILIIGAVFGLGSSTSTDGGVSAEVSVEGAPFLFTALVGFVLFALMEWKLGKTPGKFIARSRVVDALGQPISLKAALLRNLLRYVDGIGLYLVGLIVLALDDQRRRIGDFAAQTRVVND